ncbi:WecB/TagA/CpsF family glycosyltransferase [Cupriavidus sp. WKF15]|uniref:WecB/TagA/CpsF family glycosyltransferase n=1 Tax=Cupriavidus sp. WKF15 TaxID=3032282 RepID=UPI0023E2C650|nr:WecB/TagA/CpsF family glycosyltransferase [Cupriavidus sp. WKF15]WER47336.1 WecB/TagA/CpsF family glycosyltransferase [Cupriavidus sp. WKF15]
MKPLLGSRVLGSFINAVSWDEAIAVIHRWAGKRESRYVCICNVHSVVTARSNGEFSKVIKEADMCTPDGAPIAWMLRRLGFPAQERISGPDLMLRYCAHAERIGESIFLYGGRMETLLLLEQRLNEDFPALRIAGLHSPPFRNLTEDEDRQVVEKINNSGAGTVWVGLGCPKQERWMAEHRGTIKAVMIGVGAAFDYHAGTLRRAPIWMQRNGLEWLHRLCSEPSRLWKRYLLTNTLFLGLALSQLIRRGTPTRPTT